MANELPEALVAKLRKLADQELTEHDALFGESPDDAYRIGVNDGKADLASAILKEFANGE